MALPAVADSEHLNKFKLDYKQSKFSLNSYQGYIFANGKKQTCTIEYLIKIFYENNIRHLEKRLI